MTSRTHHTTDYTEFSVVVLCKEPGCGWRCQAGTREKAMILTADHNLRAHPGLGNTAQNYLRRAR